MASASGPKRIAYAFGNTLVMALGVLFGWCVRFLWIGTLETGSIHFLAGLFGLIICIPLTLLTFLQGFVAQIALVFISGVGIITPDDRISNAVAFLLSLATTLGLAVGSYLLLRGA